MRQNPACAPSRPQPAAKRAFPPARAPTEARARGEQRRAAQWPARRPAPAPEEGQRAMLRLRQAPEGGSAQNPQRPSKTSKGGRGHAAIPLANGMVVISRRRIPPAPARSRSVRVVLRVLHLAGGQARVPLGRVEQVAAGEEGVELQPTEGAHRLHAGALHLHADATLGLARGEIALRLAEDGVRGPGLAQRVGRPLSAQKAATARAPGRSM